MRKKRFIFSNYDRTSIRARQRGGRLGPEIFDPGSQNPGFFDPDKNLFLNPEPGPDLKFIASPGEKPGPARKNSKIQKFNKSIDHKIQFTKNQYFTLIPPDIIF